MSNKNLSCLRIKTDSGWQAADKIYVKNNVGAWSGVTDFRYKIDGQWKGCMPTECSDFTETFTDPDGTLLADHISDSGHTWENAGEVPLIIYNDVDLGEITTPYPSGAVGGCSDIVGAYPDEGCVSSISNYLLDSSSVNISLRLAGFSTPLALSLFWDGTHSSENGASFFYDTGCSYGSGIFVSSHIEYQDGPIYYIVSLSQYLYGNLLYQTTTGFYSHVGTENYPAYADVNLIIENLNATMSVLYDSGTYPYETSMPLYPYKQNRGIGIIGKKDTSVRGIDNISITCR